MYSLLDNFFYSFPEDHSKPPWTTKAIVDENNNSLGVEIYIAAAGVSSKNISVEEDNGFICVNIDTTDTDIPNKFKVNKQLKFNLKRHYDLSKSEVSLENGLLKIYVPYKEEKKSKRLFGNL